MTDSASTHDSLFSESVKIAILYFVLNGVFYATLAYFGGSGTRFEQDRGFSGHSVLIDIFSYIFSIITMSLILFYWRRKSIFINLLYCFFISSIVSLLGFVLTRQAYMIFFPGAGIDFSWAANSPGLFMCMAVFFGWSCMFLTIMYNFDVRDRERRLAAVREEALTAQMRALRYQINPHFLFNTMNSIAGLIEEGSGTRAGQMLSSLSTFLRTTLTVEPFHDIPLADEVALQEEYLEIEGQRFSDRMTFDICISPEAKNALVPSLILQPLVENAIKHGVGQIVGAAGIWLIARREGDKLRLLVENNIPIDAPSGTNKGMGIGLRNVAERLRVRFAEEGHFSAGVVGPGLYRASLDIPWKAA